MTVIFIGDNVIIPNHDAPHPATIVVNEATGKITHIFPRRLTLNELDRQDFELEKGSDIAWIEAGKNLILPGLVE